MTTAAYPNRSRRRLQQTLVEADETLLLRYRDTGSRSVFEQLVRRYERELYSYLRRYLGDAELAEDAFQATFLQVHLKCSSFEMDRRFRPWLYTIATNQAIDAQRRNKRHRMVSLDRSGPSDDGDDAAKLANLLVAASATPMQQVSEAERGHWLREALDELPESYRQVLNLVYFQGLKYREAADALAIPVGTVKSRIHAAILKLNEMWHQTHQEPT
jgi:RNA polymerase sigma-70 factor (ECF subfamily)